MKVYWQTSGSPGVGKSSIIQCLKNLGYPVRDEVFTQLFAKAQEEGRFDENFLRSKELIHDLINWFHQIQVPVVIS